VSDDALVTSLIARVRTLEDILDGMDCRIENNKDLALSAQAQAERAASRARDAAEAEQILRRALAGGAPEAAPYHHHARPRDRHGLRLIPGGLAAFAPLGLIAAHGGVPAVLVTGWRWLWHGPARSHFVAAAAAVAVGTAVAVPTVAAVQASPAPYTRPAVVRVHHHHHRPPWRPQPWAPAGPRDAANHASRHHPRRRVTAVLPTTAPTPTAAPTPTPSATPTAGPTPTPEPSSSGPLG
jgi:hypothetical protein